MREIEALLYIPESFYSDSVKEEVLAYGKRVLLLIYDHKSIRLVHSPFELGLLREPLRYFLFRNPRINYFFYPFVFIVHLVRIYHLLIRIRLRCRIQVMVINNAYAALLAAVMKKTGLIGKFIYLPGDWLAGNKVKKGVWSYLGSDVIFPFFDRVSCRASDLTLDCTQAIADARFSHWGRRIARRERVYQPRIGVKNRTSDLDRIRKDMVFLGDVRGDSGLEIAIGSIADLRSGMEVSLKLIGPGLEENVFLKNALASHRADPYVKRLGFIDRKRFEDELDNCFCGINLILSENSYSSKTLPSKIYDYLQFLVPVIVTRNVGPVAAIIEKHGCGQVIEPTPESFSAAAKEIFHHQAQYRYNIRKYIQENPGQGLTGFIDEVQRPLP